MSSGSHIEKRVTSHLRLPLPLFSYLLALMLLFFGGIIISFRWRIDRWNISTLTGRNSLVIIAVSSLVLWLRWSLCGFVDTDLLFFKPPQTKSAEDESLLLSQTVSKKLDNFKVNLDLEPELRWREVTELLVKRGDVERMKAVIVFQMHELFGKVGGIILSFVMKVFLTAHARFCMPEYFRRELLGIAELTTPRGLTYFDLLTLNYGGDFAANCTSGVVNALSGLDVPTPVHLRNMDWYPQEDFRHLCVQLDMFKGGEHLYSSTSWLFIVGSYTVMRRGGVGKGAYSISMNFRLQDQGILWNIVSLLGTAAWPQSLLVRDCIEHSVGYTAAVQRMSSTKLIAPCYFIVSGCASNEGVVVERCRSGVDTMDKLLVCDFSSTQTKNVDEEKEMERFVLVTNCDLRCKSIKLSWTHDDPLLMNSLVRRNAARKLFNNFFLQTVSSSSSSPSSSNKAEQKKTLEKIIDGACNVLTSAPLNNYQTVFGVVMIPGFDVMESFSWPISADSRKIDKRLKGGGYTEDDLKSMHIVKDV